MPKHNHKRNNTMPRLIAVLLTVLLLLPCATAAWAVEIPDYIPEKLLVLAEDVADAARNFTPTVSLGEGGIPVDDLKTVMALVLNDNPELIHLSSGYRYTHPMYDNNTALSVLLTFKMSKAEYDTAMAEVNTWVTGVVSLTDPDFTDLEYALFFHDYICANYEYDLGYSIRDVHSFIKAGHGVCQAYTYAYMMLLDAVGIENTFASSSEMNHIWNLVKIDGEWYHVNLTWDDPVGVAPGIAKHSFFLLSDSAISTEESGHYGWISPYECTSTRYDSTSQNQASSAYAYADGYWYFVKDGDLWRTESPTEEGSLYTEMDLRWYVWDSAAFYTSTYSGLFSKGGKLYLSTPDTLTEIIPASNSTRELYRHNGGDGYIYGFILDMGKDGTASAGTDCVVLNIGKKPGEAGYNLRVKLDGSGIDAAAGSGDANNDGKVNLADASLMLKYIAMWDVTMNMDAADVDRNGKVNLTDASNVLKIVAGW